jgi:biopolymer transport protein ExbB
MTHHFKILLFALFLGTAAPIALAQAEEGEVEVQTAEQAAAEETGQRETLLDQFQQGGWAMYPLLALSIGAVTLIIYNFVAIQSKAILSPAVAEEVDQSLGRLDVARAREICDQNPSPMANIVGAGLARIDLNDYQPEGVKEAMEEASAEELAGPFVLINYLSVIGSLAPMVGLLGTVSGMVKAFDTIRAEGAGSAQALAGNISEALITTASGMVIGIPAMFFFFYFKNRYGKITSKVGRLVGDLQFTLNSAVKAKRGSSATPHGNFSRPVSTPGS